jgi:hypothetical protein
MSPEAYRGNEPFDGVALDLYAAGLRYYFICSRGKFAFRRPDPNLDLFYRYFIVEEHLWNIDARADDFGSWWSDNFV